MAKELAALARGEVMGVVTERGTGAYEFRYEAGWRDRSNAFPLSLSMPMTIERHSGDEVRAFLAGLLPENHAVRRKWALRFGVSPNNPFALLTHMGGECPGAVQLVPWDQVEETLAEPRNRIEWLPEAQVAEILRDAARNQGTGRVGLGGYFSLAGAQPKTALVEDGGRWGLPLGRTPTTHILKPPSDDELEGLDVNEHYCLTLARALGIEAAESRVAAFEDQTAIVVTRFDRTRGAEGSPERVHQEDLCQALGVHPNSKYENEGGPGVREVLDLVRMESDRPNRDAFQFIRAVALNWVVGGSDAHAKNFAFLLEPADAVRLAPIYDLASILPYPRVARPEEVRLAMRIGAEYAMWRIGRRHWLRLADACDLDGEALLDAVRALVAAVPRACRESLERLRAEGLDHPVATSLAKTVTTRAETCLRALDPPGPS